MASIWTYSVGLTELVFDLNMLESSMKVGLSLFSLRMLLTRFLSLVVCCFKADVICNKIPYLAFTLRAWKVNISPGGTSILRSSVTTGKM